MTLSGRSPIVLPAGRYLYCGSANGPGGLKARLLRHMRRGKSVRWHIDQLTERGLVIGGWIFPGGDECELVQMCSHLPMPISGFGSSDCATCRSHLLQWSNRTALLLPNADLCRRLRPHPHFCVVKLGSNVSTVRHPSLSWHPIRGYTSHHIA